MSVTDAPRERLQPAPRPPFYRDATVVKWLLQVGALLAVVGTLFFLVRVAGDNLEARDINTSFDFLSIDPGIDLSEGIDTKPETGGRALWVGMVNTLRLAIAGIVFATILGVLVGLARLSNNLMLNKIGTAFVETLRNIPLLVQILIYQAVLSGLNRIDLTTGPINGWLHVSNKGIGVPRIHPSDGFYQWLVIMLIGAFVARFVYKSRAATQDNTGADTKPGLGAFGVLIVFAIIGWFIHPIFSWLDAPFEALSDFFGAIPERLVQVLLSALAIGLALNWIRKFLNSRRTPAGLAKLTDDDYFRMIFAGIAAVIAVFVVLRLWPGLSSWIINSTSDFFGVVSDKFGDSRPLPLINEVDGEVLETPLVGELSSSPWGFEQPNIVKRGNFANPGTEGINMSIGFASVFLGVWFYTAAFVGEIVRGGILAVPKGQTEAAAAVGLRRSTALRRIILPQAFRVVLPPLGNQYLNLTKNTSLAIAVGMSDMTQVSQTIGNQTGKQIEVLVISMLFYLSCSLTISVVVNWFNVRLKIVER